MKVERGVLDKTIAYIHSDLDLIRRIETEQGERVRVPIAGPDFRSIENFISCYRKSLEYWGYDDASVAQVVKMNEEELIGIIPYVLEQSIDAKEEVCDTEEEMVKMRTYGEKLINEYNESPDIFEFFDISGISFLALSQPGITSSRS